ncbi:MAG: MFS transporter [Gammaproteobacteria bacterium]|nr:MFS transporter [Gammaproteobacteria bacterium]MCP5424720.1 MFS transporter [Gammaproteobacteria bacterium]MCP5459245.1 MFS transporter [Gammaproteobacteria bacterium]
MSENPPNAAKSPAEGISAWSPFRHSVFAILWCATVVSNIGTWMNDVGSSWLMASMAPSPLMVALVQSATTLPIFLFALPAGALADSLDRRRLLMGMQTAMAITVAVLATLVWLGWMNAYLLLFFAFLLGTGTAFSAPTWQAIVPQLIPREDLQAALALNSVGINISRAIGPALAGFMIVGIGMAAPFAFNALSFLGVIAALGWWRPPPSPPNTLPVESLGNAIVTGLRYTHASAPLKATLLRGAAFFIFGSAFWALLPLVAKHELQGGAKLYGILLGSVGLGAVLGAMVLPRLKRRINISVLVGLATTNAALVMGLLASSRIPAVAVLSCLLFGASWITILSSISVSAQFALPEWVRARGLSVFLTVFFGSMALGSAIWGKIAESSTLPTALLLAASGALLAIPLSWKAQLTQGAGLDLSPSMHWPQPIVTLDAPHDRGPVMVMIEHQVDESDRQDFLAALTEQADARRRAGAVTWGVVEDAERPGRFVEYFMEDSWLGHLRHHQRVTQADKQLQERVHSFHRGTQPPHVAHYLAPRLNGLPTRK